MINGQQQREREHETGDNNDNNHIVDIFAHWMVSVMRLLSWQTFNYWHGYRFLCLHEQSNIHTTMRCTALCDGIGTAEQHTYRENELSAGAHIKFGCQSHYASIRIIIYGARPLNQGTVCNFPCNATCEHFKPLRCDAACVCVCVFFRLYFC